MHCTMYHITYIIFQKLWDDERTIFQNIAIREEIKSCCQYRTNHQNKIQTDRYISRMEIK